MSAAPANRPLVGDSSLLLASNLAVSALSFAGTAAVARALAPEDWGALTFLLGLTSIFGFLFDFNVGRRVLADAMDADDARHAIGSFVGLRLAQGLTAYAATLLFVVVGPYPGEVVAAAALLGTVQLFAAARTGFTLFFRLHLRFRAIAVAGLAARLVTVAMTLVLLASGVRTLLWFVVPHVLDAVLFMIAVWAALRRHGGVRPSFAPRQWAPWIRESLLVGLGSSIGIAYLRVDGVMLSMMGGLGAVAFYGIGYKFADLLAYVPDAVRAPLSPLLVRAWPGDQESFARNVRGAFVLLTTVALALVATFCMFAEPAIGLAFGDRYRPAANAARLVAASQGLHFVTALYVSTLISVGRHRVYPAAGLAGLAFNVGINLYLIPAYSFRGAAAATVATEVLVLTIVGAAVRGLPGCRPLPWAPLRRAVLATAALVVTGAAAAEVVPWPLAAAAGLAVFAGVLHIIGLDGPGGLRAVPGLMAAGPHHQPPRVAETELASIGRQL